MVCYDYSFTGGALGLGVIGAFHMIPQLTSLLTWFLRHDGHRKVHGENSVEHVTWFYCRCVDCNEILYYDFINRSGHD